LFYSVNRNEKETACGANHLSRDFGNGEEIGGSGATGAEKAVRSLRGFLRPTDGTSDVRRPVLGMQALEN
jgi:hypothetical protein